MSENTLFPERGEKCIAQTSRSFVRDGDHHSGEELRERGSNFKTHLISQFASGLFFSSLCICFKFSTVLKNGHGRRSKLLSNYFPANLENETRREFRIK